MMNLICAATLLVIPPGEKAVKQDWDAVLTAGRRCVELYPQSPCAVKVVRVRDLTYHVYCGRPK